MWENVGMARTRQSLEAAIGRIRELRQEFWQNVNVPGTDADLNVALERAGRVADFMEFGELLAQDALAREESCGGHFREEYQYPDGEAKRDDDRFGHVAAWEYAGAGPGAGPERRAADLGSRAADGAELQVTVQPLAASHLTTQHPMKLTLHVWRQKDRHDSGRMETYPADHVSPDMSFLEMLDEVNEGLIKQGKDPIAFDHDCREGICGSCAHDDQRHAARPGAGDHGLPAPHAEVPATASTSTSSRGGRRRSRSSRTW